MFRDNSNSLQTQSLKKMNKTFGYNHGGMMEKEMQLFFLSEISIYLS